MQKTYRFMKDTNNIRRIKYRSENNSFFDEKVSYIIDSLDDAHKLSQRSFLQRVFEATFKLIPEAEKGSFYELNDDKYTPIFSMNYDFELLKKLSFNKDDAFIDFECDDTSSIDAYQVYISKCDDSKFSKEIKNYSQQSRSVYLLRQNRLCCIRISVIPITRRLSN